ncbi:uncharacterized protein CIMG_05456 [Coccidioides immitis RS]|uniref:Myb-like domain-containing protein n=2 Tax=Coccidioides immitis TaxID=5501 RepID=A0A0E1RXQ1_COCIM|nr:uncharacterized protein CIMG_05456 [Coccidioides immitis RS]EAS34432.1 hypothetical protein CIMG_05456 [Coccidioides immitis RS]KMU91147.1 hypothetical protein CIHG_08896 [Coccidioides immitis H538.4]TPX21873.1 hypothetical protein DIZ76_015838 [Coccidioides immitis]
MSPFTAINHPGVEDSAIKMEDVEDTNTGDVSDEGEIKSEDRQEEQADDGPAKEKKGEKEPKNPATPRKRGRKPGVKKDAAIKTENSDEGNKENVNPDDDGSPQKKQRMTPGKKSRPIPTSIENACEEDKMLLRLKDKENKSWSEIASAWTKMTGEATKGTTLSTRYMRIKANLAVLSKDDEILLLKVKKDMEEKFEAEKWQRIAESMEQTRGAKFPPLTLQKKFKELEKKGNGEDAV